MGEEPKSTFQTSVFLNCPFDNAYVSLLRPLLFTTLDLGYSPRIASESFDSGESRLRKIYDLIGACKYSIHDISRLRASEEGAFSRMNMPFELGIEFGCREFADNHLADKKTLVLETHRYDYLKALSDLAGSDIKNHQDDPVEIVRVVRNWFVEADGSNRASPARQILYRFNDFTSDFYDARMEEGYSDDDLNMMPVPEYIAFICDWLSNRDKDG